MPYFKRMIVVFASQQPASFFFDCNCPDEITKKYRARMLWHSIFRPSIVEDPEAGHPAPDFPQQLTLKSTFVCLYFEKGLTCSNNNLRIHQQTMHRSTLA